MDRGRTWRRLPGFPRDPVGINGFAPDALHPGRLLAAPSTGGFWRGDFDLR